MLLNICTEETLPQIGIKAVASLGHGSWKRKRIQAKKVVHGMKKTGTTVIPTLIKTVYKPKPPKVKVVEPIVETLPETIDISGANSVPLGERKPVEKSIEKLVAKTVGRPHVSSLFSFNPSVVASVAPVLEITEKPQISVFSLESDTFAGLGVQSLLASHLETKLGFKQPTAIQKAAIPDLLSREHKDVILQAQTGSGKSIAFLVPLLQKLLVAQVENPDLHGVVLNTPSNDIKDDDEEDKDEKKHVPSVMFERTMGTLAIVLAPTRELARQLFNVFESLLKINTLTPDPNDASPSFKHWVVPGIITGGEKKKSEKARIRKGINVLFCTPGRLLDHLKTTNSFNVSNVRWLILDEADHLLEMGFEPTLQEILSILNMKQKNATYSGARVHVYGWPSKRQTILCSATIEDQVSKLCEDSLVQPVFIKVEAPVKEVVKNQKVSGVVDMTKLLDEKEQTITVPSQLKQTCVVAPAKLRLMSLVGLIRQYIGSNPSAKLIVFMATGDTVDWHHFLFTEYDQFVKESQEPSARPLDTKPKSVNKDTFNSQNKSIMAKGVEGLSTTLFPDSLLFKLHGNMQQSDRQKTLAAFSGSDDKHRILFCTDVAARGLDLPAVSHIIQFDPPSDSKDYIHRIGRTARIGAQGQATLFLLPSEMEYLNLLTTSYSVTLNQIEPAEILPYLPPEVGHTGSKKLTRKEGEFAATELQMNIEKSVLADPEIQGRASKAFTSFIRAYATHSASERGIFHVKFLHLGHIAKSFGLRSAPSHLAAIKQQNMAKTAEPKPDSNSAQTQLKRKAVMAIRTAMTSEFGDGNAIQLSKVNNKRLKKK